MYLSDLQQSGLRLYYYGSTTGVENTFMGGKMSGIHVITSMQCPKITQNTVHHKLEYMDNKAAHTSPGIFMHNRFDLA